jgi:hypothetical protein
MKRILIEDYKGEMFSNGGVDFNISIDTLTGKLKIEIEDKENTLIHYELIYNDRMHETDDFDKSEIAKV